MSAWQTPSATEADWAAQEVSRPLYCHTDSRNPCCFDSDLCHCDCPDCDCRYAERMGS